MAASNEMEIGMNRWLTWGAVAMFSVLSGAASAVDIRLTPVATGLSNPLYLTHAGDGSGRLFILEQAGRIRISQNGALAPTPYLDISNIVLSNGSEQGLLGLAFAPDYATSGRFYINYVNLSGDTVIARGRVSSNPALADRATLETLLTIDQPFDNHNGGWMGFGRDGFLYIASGDGGSSNDPQNNAQNLNSLLGKMLRINVSGATGYTSPPSNPFVSTPDARPEIWAYGLRNPWRPSFDRSSGDLWIADVGQSRTEEINFQQASSAGGENYGWRVMEGSTCRTTPCTAVGVLPVSEYGRDMGCSITGGYVYRGTAYPALAGNYLVGDFCSGRIWMLERTSSAPGTASFIRTQILQSGRPISSFGEDQSGNIYLVDYTGSVLLVSDGAPVAASIDASYTGSWFDPAQSGHGLFLEVLPNNQLLAWWFTFSPDGQQSWFGGVGAIVGNRANINVIRTTGGRFIPNFNPATVQNQPFGSMSLSFTDCRSGRVEFNLPEGYGQGSMNLTRLTIPSGVQCTP